MNRKILIFISLFFIFNLSYSQFSLYRRIETEGYGISCRYKKLHLRRLSVNSSLINTQHFQTNRFFSSIELNYFVPSLNGKSKRDKRKYKLKLNQKTYFIDLFFYNRVLKCLVAVELKTVEFEPEFAEKMNFYLELLDYQEKLPDDNPSIVIILCPEKDNIEVEFALRPSNKPIGVSEYSLTNKLPEQFKGKGPTPKELKQMLSKLKVNLFKTPHCV